MKIKYYGTAAAEGWPALFCACPSCREAKRRGGKNIRTRSQASIDGTLLIDFPPDTYMHMLYGGLELPRYKSCIVTHAHEDHLYPYDIGTRAHGYADELEAEILTFYGSDSVIEWIEALPDWAKDRERIAWNEVREYVPFEVEGYTVTPMLAAHGQWQSPPLKCFIYMIEKDGERLLYGNDTGCFPESTWKFIRGKRFDLISLDCTMLEHREGRNHMGIEDVVEVQKRLIEMGCADGATQWVINHFSHNGHILHEELEEIMRPHGFSVAYDGFEIS
ncbi:MAG: MBL fold metallo-hydrolase, partial [Candidatus Faecivicinus sp.]